MPIDMASVYADRFKASPQILQAAVLGQAPIPGLDPYTALRSLQLIKESQRMQMAQAAQQPTQAPSLVDQAVAQPVPQLQPQMPQGAPQSQGLAGMPSNMPADESGYAGGGMVAFANGGSSIGDVTGGGMRVFANDLEDDEEGGDVGTQRFWASRARAASRRAVQSEYVEPESPEQMAATQQRIYKQLQAQAGESPFKAFLAKYDISPEKAAKMKDQDLGMALLEASGAALQPGGTMRGLAAAASTLGRSYGASIKARRQEEMAMDRVRADMLDAERKERMGLSKEASAIMERARKDRIEAARYNAQADRLEAQTAAQMATALRPRGEAKAAEPKPELEGVRDLAAFYISKGMKPVEAKAMAVLNYRGAGAGISGQPKSMKDARDALKSYQILNPEAWEKKVQTIGVEAATDQFIDEYQRGAISPPFQQLPGSAPRATPAPSAAPAKPSRSNW
jgi:hypothetical protein